MRLFKYRPPLTILVKHLQNFQYAQDIQDIYIPFCRIIFSLGSNVNNKI